jgi:hypothetical protein
MYELIAIGVGIAIGYAVSGVEPSWRGVALAVPLAIVGGTTVTAISGELEISAEFILVDIGQAAVAAVLTLALVRTYRLRARTREDIDRW